jgi:hypothetical protein
MNDYLPDISFLALALGIFAALMAAIALAVMTKMRDSSRKMMAAQEQRIAALESAIDSLRRVRSQPGQRDLAPTAAKPEEMAPCETKLSLAAAPDPADDVEGTPKARFV